MTSITNWLCAIALALVLGTAYHLDGPSELEAVAATAQESADAAHEAYARERVARSAQRACGDNAAFQMLDGTTVQCLTKRGLLLGLSLPQLLVLATALGIIVTGLYTGGGQGLAWSSPAWASVGVGAWVPVGGRQRLEWAPILPVKKA